MEKLGVLLLIVLSLLPISAHAQDRLTYVSQPDELAIFLNNIAYVKDSITLPGATQAQIVLPDQAFADTLILRENGQRVKEYRFNRATGQMLLTWDAVDDAALREVTLEYLISGISWQPLYDMVVNAEDTAADLNFFAQITNSVLLLDEARVRLIAGRVDTTAQVGEAETMMMNQMLTQSQSYAATPAASVGAVTIQNIYPLDTPLTLIPGDTLYLNLLEKTVPVRRLLLWNASADRLVTVIYKVANDSTLPFAEGVVRSYREGLFVGSDYIETTPVGGEGSVTVGRLQNVRAERTASVTAIDEFGNDFYQKYDVTLTLTSFNPEALEIEIVDFWPAGAGDFVFSSEPAREGDNVLRWVVTLEPNATLTITYSYKV